MKSFCIQDLGREKMLLLKSNCASFYESFEGQSSAKLVQINTGNHQNSEDEQRNILECCGGSYFFQEFVAM